MKEELTNKIEQDLIPTFKELDDLCLFNSAKILEAFQNNHLSVSHFNGTTGYGYGDLGRDTIEKIYADIFKCESALVRNQFISGTHALTVALFGILRPNDTLLSIAGLPYDTLYPVIGLTQNDSSLKSFNINYEYLNLINNDFNYPKIENILKNKNIKMIHIQRSIGYSNRNTISIESLEKVITFIKNINSNIIIMVDNCYCELCSKKEPTEVGADIVVGSLIKNLGAGITNNGAYIVGKEKYISLCAERLTSPGLGFEVGPSLNQNRAFLLGLYMAPNAITSALKVKCLTRNLFNNLNYETINNDLNDIVLGIKMKSKEELIKYIKLIQANSAIDSSFTPEPTPMPGYDDKIIMASGSFTDGSSIELSCDAPIREPYIAYQQGSLTYEYGKIGVVKAIKGMLE